MRSNSAFANRKSRILRKMANMRAAKERKRLERPPPERIDRPEPGRWLETIRIERPTHCVEIKVYQAKRLNQIVVEVFGKRSKPHGWDWLHRNLRQRSVVRWLHD